MSRDEVEDTPGPETLTSEQYLLTQFYVLLDNLDLVPQLKDGIEVEINDILIKVQVSKKGG